jgi:PIN domain
MCKVKVAIDTSTLRSDARLSSGPMEALARFAEKGHVEILIPSVVAGEFTSKPSAKIESLEELHKTLKKLKYNVPSDLHVIIAEFETRIAEEFDRLEAVAKQRFTEWQKRTGAKIVQPAADHAARVMHKYFAGTLPFGSVKARTDIPDAFIVETILDLASQGELLAVADDGRVAEALKKIPVITVFKSIKNLLESDEFEEALADIGVDTETEYETANIDKVVMEFLRDHARFHRSMEEHVASLVAGKTLDYHNPHYDEREGPDEIYIDSVEEASDWTFDGTSDYLGEGVILVNFEARVEVSADDPMGGPWHDEEGNLDSSRMVTISGAVSISLDPVDLLQKPINTSGQELLKAATVSIDELDDISLVARSH